MPCCGQRVRVYTPDSPLVIGEPLGAPVYVRSTVGLRGLAYGMVAWVDGSGVESLLQSGMLLPA